MDVVTILFRRVQEMTAEFIRLLPQLSIAVLVLLATFIVAKSARRIAERLLQRTELRGTLVNLVETLVSVLIWAFGLLVTMSIVFPGVTPANILAVLGLGSVAVGFAFKDIFENFLAGVLIMLRKQMRIGDVIECEDLEGRVEMISLRDTHLRQLSGEIVIVPNAFLFKNPVTVVTQKPKRRHSVEVGVGYGVDLDAAHGVIADAVKSCPSVDTAQKIEVYAKAFADSAITFLVRWWAGSKPAEAHASRDEVVRAIKRALDAAAMEMPYPYRTLTFREPLAITRERPRGAEGDQADDGARSS